MAPKVFNFVIFCQLRSQLSCYSYNSVYILLQQESISDFFDFASTSKTIPSHLIAQPITREYVSLLPPFPNPADVIDSEYLSSNASC